jgi:hypothetical protein
MTKTLPDYILNSKAVIDYFGYWPTFHDDKIIDIINDHKKRSIELIIESAIGIKLGEQCKITFLFEKVKEFKIDYCSDVDLGFDVISEIDFKKIDNDFIKVSIDPAVGLIADIICKNIKVDKFEIFKSR